MTDEDVYRSGLERGVEAGAARQMAQTIGAAQRSGTRAAAEAAWQVISESYIKPGQDFALHAWLYEQCYGFQALTQAPGPAWFPSTERVAGANVTRLARELGMPGGYRALHRWSVENREAYWERTIETLRVRFRRPYARLLDASRPTRPEWLVGAQLNIVESCFQADPASVAIVESTPAGSTETMSVGELRKLSARVANGLAWNGIGPGDTVAMIAPLSRTTVATYLGVIAAGATVVSIADSFAAEEIATRLRIAKVRMVITQDAIRWGGKRIGLYERVAAASTVPVLVVQSDEGVPTLRAGDRLWKECLSGDESLRAIPGAAQDAINILFSSGTTGEPKAIPWDHTTPIKCAADAHFHHDLHPGDVACWPTNLGWMMGPWLIFAALMNQATLALHLQAPQDRAFGQFVQNAGVTMLGCVPSLVRAWRQSGCMRGLDWSAVRAFSSTGECSNPSDMLYLMHLAGYRPVIEYCGGTEIGGAYLTSTVVEPNIPATFSTPALGLEVEVFDQGRRAPVGEVFIAGPSIGLSTRLLNRDHDAVYFGDTPVGADGAPLRRHGDELELLAGGYYRMVGRADDTMNLGGIKVGCAEIERVLQGLPQVLDTAAVAVPPPGGGPSQLVIFAVLRAGVEASAAEVLAAMQVAIREQLSPLFRVHQVHLVAALPRTASNKILRRDLRAGLTRNGGDSGV